MSNLDVFGPLKDATAVERAVIRILGGDRALRQPGSFPGWLHGYLEEVESRAPGETPGGIARPRTWQADIDTRRFPETQLPAVICVVETPSVLSNGGTIGYRWRVTAGVIYRGSSRQRGRDVVRLVTAAMAGALYHHPDLGGLATDMSWPIPSFGEASDGGPIAATGQLDFTVLVPDSLGIYDGPLEPTPLPDPAPGTPPTYPSDPTVVDSDVTVDPEETP
jgi:hypothetical protein